MKQQLIFLDLETTGLNPQDDLVLEIAMIAVDDRFNEVATFERVIVRLPKDLDRRMNDFVREMHTANGLLEDTRPHVEGKGVPQWNAYDDACSWLPTAPDRLILAGNSIHFDRRFLREDYPDFEDRFYRRMFDVSAFLVAAQTYELPIPEQESGHRALADCRRSIAFAKHWCDVMRGRQAGRGDRTGV